MAMHDAVAARVKYAHLVLLSSNAKILKMSQFVAVIVPRNVSQAVLIVVPRFDKSPDMDHWM